MGNILSSKIVLTPTFVASHSPLVQTWFPKPECSAIDDFLSNIGLDQAHLKRVYACGGTLVSMYTQV